MEKYVMRAELAPLFSWTYQEARVKFRTAAEQRQAAFQSVVHPLAGFNGEELAIDVAVLGAGQPQKTVLISSGLHGVEGYFGSAVQLALLEELADFSLPENLRLVLVHGLNPWGFSHVRRFDHENIDCNRNFLLAGEKYSGSPELYKEIDDFLNPKRIPQGVDGFRLQALALLRQYGASALQQAIAAGQHDFPQGLFYGGVQPSWTHQQFSQHWLEWTASAPEVIHLDLHTGLGEFAEGEALIDYQVEAGELEFLDQVFGEDHVRTEREASTATEQPLQVEAPYLAKGSLGPWCRENYPHGRYLYCCLEFGTFRPLRVLKKLRLENQAHFYCSAIMPRRSRFKRKLKRMFCPPRRRWRKKTVNQSLEWIFRILER